VAGEYVGNDSALAQVAETAAAAIGRPTKYSIEWAERFCDLIAEGQSVRQICSQPGQPDKSQVYRWLDENDDFRDQYARAREEQADTLAAKIMTVVAGVEPEPGKVSKARLQFDAYRWHVGKLAPKVYGDRIEHDVKGGMNFQPQSLIQCSSAGEEQEYNDISAASEAAGSLPQQGNGNSRGGRR